MAQIANGEFAHAHRHSQFATSAFWIASQMTRSGRIEMPRSGGTADAFRQRAKLRECAAAHRLRGKDWGSLIANFTVCDDQTPPAATGGDEPEGYPKVSPLGETYQRSKKFRVSAIIDRLTPSAWRHPSVTAPRFSSSRRFIISKVLNRSSRSRCIAATACRPP